MSDCTVFPCGDVISAEFSGEDCVVVFLPNSGEVLHCATHDWLSWYRGDTNEGSDLGNMLANWGIYPN